GAAGDVQETVLLPRGVVVDQPGQEGLARAGLAVEQDGDVVIGGQGDAFHQRQQRGRLGQELAGEQVFQRFGAPAREIPAPAALVPRQLGQYGGVLRPAQAPGYVRVQGGQQIGGNPVGVQ